MAKHAIKGSSFFKKAVTGTSLLALAAAPAIVMNSSSYGSDACLALDDGVTGATAESFTGNICQLTFTADVASWTLPSQVTKLSVVGIGGGGGALSVGSLGYGGAGGQFNALDTVSLVSRDFNITVGAAGANATSGTSGNAGADTILKNIVSGTPNTALVTAAGGLGGDTTADIDSSWLYQLDGIKIAYGDPGLYNNYANTDGSIPGAGTAGHSGGTTNGGDGSGGAGKKIEDVVNVDGFGIDYLDPTLWATDSAILGSGVSLKGFEFGSGGGITATPNTANTLSGQGAAVSADGSTAGTAGNGVLIMRFELVTNFTVTFDANGGSGSMSNQTASSSTALTTNTLTRAGFTFAGWNTAADGSGTAYADGASFAFSVDDTLYAQWTSSTPVAPAPYSGPIPVRLEEPRIPSGSPKANVLIGTRLSGITRGEVDGKEVVVSKAEDGRVELTLPGLEPGLYTIKYYSSSGQISHQDSLTVFASTTASTGGESEAGSDSGTATPATTVFRDAKRFYNYLGDRGRVIAADENAIRAFLGQYENVTRITCIGSTSGVPAISTDEALATARAENACRIAREVFPDAVVSLKTNTGVGTGQFYRAVSIYLVGKN